MLSIAKIDHLSDEDMQREFPDVEIAKIHNKLVIAYNTYLKHAKVKAPWSNNSDVLQEVTDGYTSASDIVKKITAKELWLIFLYKYKGCLVHRDLIAKFVQSKIPNAARDQQVRHIGRQDHWYVLNRDAKIPDVNMVVPSGYHYLVSIETPNPNLFKTYNTREGRLAAKSFDDLKFVYANKCVTCGIKEGEVDTRNNVKVKLQQGHMNPRKELTLENTIPQCQYCNQTNKDNFEFDMYGRPVIVTNTDFLLKAPPNLQDEYIAALLSARSLRESK